MSGLKIFKIGGYPLESQIALINPKIIVTLGNVPTQFLLETTKGIT
jgi:DNA polymerase